MNEHIVECIRRNDYARFSSQSALLPYISSPTYSTQLWQDVPLHRACQKFEDKRFAEELLAAGHSAKLIARECITPVMVAAVHSEKLLTWLLADVEGGAATINWVDARGKSALDYALDEREEGCADVIRRFGGKQGSEIAR